MFFGAERSVQHPNLGIQGTAVTFNQPLCSAAVGVVNPGTSTYAINFFASDGPASTWPPIPGSPSGARIPSQWYIDLNPSSAYLGGPLSTMASRFLKYRFTNISITWTTAASTVQIGTFGLAIVDDPGSVAAVVTGFNALREVVPNVIAPYRIPEATLNWGSGNTTLFYIEAPDYVAPGNAGSVPDARQTIQATLCGLDSGLLWLFSGPSTPGPTTLGQFTISGECEFYEPIPPTDVPSTSAEKAAVSAVLSLLRTTGPVPQRPTGQVYRAHRSGPPLRDSAAAAAATPGSEDFDALVLEAVASVEPRVLSSGPPAAAASSASGSLSSFTRLLPSLRSGTVGRVT
jgi:hypothetical protein